MSMLVTTDLYGLAVCGSLIPQQSLTIVIHSNWDPHKKGHYYHFQKENWDKLSFSIAVALKEFFILLEYTFN